MRSASTSTRPRSRGSSATSLSVEARRLKLAYWWAIGGVGALFLDAAVQLGRRAFVTVSHGIAPLAWLALTIVTFGFVYGEGVLALERRWIPRMIGRAAELHAGSPRVYRVLAPLYAMSLIGDGRGRVVRSWLGVAAIVVAVLVVRALPEPWRGIIDAGVCAALLWGLVAIVRQAVAPPAVTPRT